MSADFDLVQEEAPTTLTERAVLDLLHARYSAEAMGASRYAVAEHAPNGIGYMRVRRIADFIAQDTYTTHVRRDGRPATWSYGGYDGERRTLLHGHEVKVSRGDWLRELADPSKAEAWSRYCDRWWLVAPSNVVRDGELPAGWGLLTVVGGGLRAKVQAPLLDPEPMPVETRAALLRAVQKTAERHTRAAIKDLTNGEMR